MEGLAGLLLYTLIGFGVTVITQSSHATLTLALAALAVGQEYLMKMLLVWPSGQTLDLPLWP